MIKTTQKKYALWIWIATAIAAITHMVVFYQEFQGEVIDLHRDIKQTSSTIADHTNQRFVRFIDNNKAYTFVIAHELARLPSLQTKPFGQVSAQDFDFELLDIVKGNIAAITSLDGDVLYAKERQHALQLMDLLENNKFKQRLLLNGYTWHLFYNKQLGRSSLISHAYIKQGNVPKAIVTMAYPIEVTYPPIVSTPYVLIMNEFNTAYQITQVNTRPIQVFTPDTPKLTSEMQTVIVQRTGTVPEQSLNISYETAFGIEFARLDLLGKQRFIQSVAQMTDNNLRVQVFYPADDAFEEIEDEVIEGVVQLILIILAALLIQHFVHYHFMVRQITYIDKLTHLYNRAHFQEISQKYVHLHQRGRVTHLGALALDIDYFKSVNDKYGHDVGDAVLTLFAKTIRNASRESDYIARLGGEEFMILCLEEPYSALLKYAERLRLAVQNMPEMKQYVAEGLTVSIGIALKHPDETIESWLKRADVMLYKAKENGRNRVEIEPL